MARARISWDRPVASRLCTGVAGCAATVLALLALSGCRAFSPPATLVNRAPETFITGGPAEFSGGYYRFHAYWYGRDEDGRVERFVWALTDGTRQDPDTDDDEEDEQFNPGLNVSTLAIGHWTSRTDSLFNFVVDDGANPSALMTLHLVAQDDRGAFDRTPARLTFFANTLGTPALEFFRIDGADTARLAFGAVDTVGYGQPYRLAWRARSPNVRGYGEAALATIDTLPPSDDGILGYKWLLSGIVGEACDPSREDCWRPRHFNESTNDSFSYFGDVTGLFLANDGSGDGPLQRRLPSSTLQLSVNAIDIAGVEIAEGTRRTQFVVNYDPETLILDGEPDWAHPEDPQTYPYYIDLDDPTRESHPFRSGERIPDRTYVVVKALARDDPRDRRLDPDYAIGLTGHLRCNRRNYTGGLFNFASEASEMDLQPAWGPGEGGWYGDTLGFLTAPNTEFTVNLLSVDELERRDGTPATLSFDVGFPPCLQCIELLPKPGLSTSAFDATVPCLEDPEDAESHPCLQGIAELRLSDGGTGPSDLQEYGTTYMLIHRDTGYLKVTPNPLPAEMPDYYVLPSRLYKFAILLHGRDDPRDAWPEPLRRIGGWHYQVSHACDVYNVQQDGGGDDDIRVPMWGPLTPQTIDPDTGVWKLEVQVPMPTILVEQGPAVFRAFLYGGVTAANQDAVDMIFKVVTRQLGDGWVDAIAVDQTICGRDPDRPARFNFFRNVRVPEEGLPEGVTWRDCGLDGYFGIRIKEQLALTQHAMPSLEGRPVRKRFRLTLATPGGDVVCEGD